MNVETMTPLEKSRHEAALRLAIPPSRPPSAAAAAAEALGRVSRTAATAAATLHEIRETLSRPAEAARAFHRDGEGEARDVLKACRDAVDAVRELARGLPDVAAAAEACRKIVRGL